MLLSLMVKLRCQSFAERANIPAFIFFFQMLYPFRWVNVRPTASPQRPEDACWCVPMPLPVPGVSTPFVAR